MLHLTGLRSKATVTHPSTAMRNDSCRIIPKSIIRKPSDDCERVYFAQLLFGCTSQQMSSIYSRRKGCVPPMRMRNADPDNIWDLRHLNFQNSNSRCPLWWNDLRQSIPDHCRCREIDMIPICRSTDFQLKVEESCKSVSITFSATSLRSVFSWNGCQIPRVKGKNWRFKLSTASSSTTRSSTSFW